MANKFTLSVGMAHELEHGMNRNGGWDGELVKALGQGDNLAKVRDLLLGRATLQIIDHIVDGDADPFLPNGWTVESHQKQGACKIERKGDDLYVNGKKLGFYLAKGQQNGKAIEGHKLRKELADKPTRNANLLDRLLANPELIPDSWKVDANGNTRYIFFWSTIYRNSGGVLYVRYLYWFDGQWQWRYAWLGDDFASQNPAVVCEE